MTNEELAIKIKAGETGYYAELWENVKGLLTQWANRYYFSYSELCISAGVTAEDIVQNSYFALTSAVAAFDPESELTFVSYMKYPFKNQVRTLLGIRTSYRDALNYSTSVNAAIGNNSENSEDLTFEDIIADETAEEKIQNTVETIFNQDLKKAILEQLCSLPSEEQEIISNHYFKRRKFTDISKNENKTVAEIRELYKRAIKKLSSGKRLTALKPFAEEIFGRSIKNTGITSFKYNRASSVELTLEWLERNRKTVNKF